MSLKELVCTLGPVRDTLLPDQRPMPPPPPNTAAAPSESAPPTLNRLTSDQSVSSVGGNGGDLDVPKELWRLVDALWMSGMKEQGWFDSAGSEEEVRWSIRIRSTHPPALGHSLYLSFVLMEACHSA